MHHDHPSAALSLAPASSPDRVPADAEQPQVNSAVEKIHRLLGSPDPEGAQGTFLEVGTDGPDTDIPDDILLEVHIPNPATVHQEARSSPISTSSIHVSRSSSLILFPVFRGPFITASI